MSKRAKVSTRNFLYLENATSIPLECSDVESELYDSDGEFLNRQIDPQGSDDNSAIIESSDEEILDKDNIDQSVVTVIAKIFQTNVQDDACNSLPVLKTKVEVTY